MSHFRLNTHNLKCPWTRPKLKTVFLQIIELREYNKVAGQELISGFKDL